MCAPVIDLNNIPLRPLLAEDAPVFTTRRIRKGLTRGRKRLGVI